MLQDLPPDDRRRLEAQATRVPLALNQVLYWPDEPIAHVWFPIDAIGSLLTLLGAGDSVEAGLVGHEGVIGLPLFLADIVRALAPGGELMVVGPDVFRVIEHWRDGREPWQLVESAMETPWPYASPEEDGATWAVVAGSSEARDHWNCYEARVVWALRQVDGLAGVEPMPIVEGGELARWPLVAYTQWQCAVRARRAE